jgi:hypothetical protein
MFNRGDRGSYDRAHRPRSGASLLGEVVFYGSLGLMVAALGLALYFVPLWRGGLEVSRERGLANIAEFKPCFDTPGDPGRCQSAARDR